MFVEIRKMIMIKRIATEIILSLINHKLCERVQVKPAIQSISYITNTRTHERYITNTRTRNNTYLSRRLCTARTKHPQYL